MIDILSIKDYPNSKPETNLCLCYAPEYTHKNWIVLQYKNDKWYDERNGNTDCDVEGFIEIRD